MVNVEKINQFIAEGVKKGNIDREIGFEIFKAINQGETLQNNDIAIIGMACKLPEADTPKEYWNNLIAERCSVRYFPTDRWDDVKHLMRADQRPETTFFEAGYLKEIDKFDADFFRISPQEAMTMDPWQRLFLQTVFHAMEDGGYGGEKLSGTSTAVYVGIDHTYKTEYIPKNSNIDFTALTGSYHAILASRVSYILNLKGPSMTIDTACSSGLVAIDLACKALKNKECTTAIAGGINLFIFPDQSRSGVGLLESEDNTLRAFDKDSMGSAWGEGVGAILLKPLKKAIEDGDHIHAVIKASAVNNNGTSSGITALSAKAQEELLVKAWKDGKINPETIGYIEAHATGTMIGDSIEVRGITDAFKKHTNKKQFCGIGSVKTNIGHMVSASGIASLIKVVMALKEKQIPATINFNQPNPFINFLESPIYINNRLKKWETSGDVPRRGGVSAFGFSGTNAHIVLEEAPAMVRNEEEIGKIELFTLSAKTKRSLIRLMEKYLELFTEDRNIGIKDLCFTANVGRGQYNERIIMKVRSVEEILENLQLIIQFGLQDLKIPNCYYTSHKIVSSLKKDCEAGEITEDYQRKITSEINSKIKSYSNKQLDLMDELLEEIYSYYTMGATIQWELIYGKGRKRIPLPTYSFENTRFWPPDQLMIRREEVFLESPSNEIFHFELGQKDIKKGLYQQICSGEDVKIEFIGKKNDDDYTTMEKDLGNIVGGLLGVEKINIYQNFFEMGMDSIIAMKMVNRINQNLKTSLGPVDVMGNPSIAELAHFIEVQDSSAGNIGKVFTIESSEEKDYYPLSIPQQSIFVMEGYDRNSTAYNIPQIMLIEGLLNVPKLEEAFRQVVLRHEALRTSFHIEDGQPVQKIHKEVAFKIDYWESSKENEKELITNFIKPFNISEAPLFRVKLVKFSDEQHLFMLDINHIIADAESIMVLIREAVLLYYDMELSPIYLHYKDFAVWQKNAIETGLLDKQKKYWLEHLKGGLPDSSIPLDYERSEIKSFEGDRVTITLDTETTDKIKGLAISTNTTTYMILFTILNIVISKYNANEDVIIGSPIMGRPNVELENTIGMFVNMLAIRNYPRGEKSFSTLLLEVKESILAAYENQQYPFDALLKELNIKKSLKESPLFNISFSVQEISTPEMNINQLKFKPINHENYIAVYDLVLAATEGNDSIIFNLDYCRRLFKKVTIDLFMEDYLFILKKVLVDWDVKLKEITLKSEEKIVKRKVTKLEDVELNFNF